MAQKNVTNTSTQGSALLVGRNLTVDEGTEFVVEYSGGAVATANNTIFIQISFEDGTTPVTIAQKFTLAGNEIPATENFPFVGVYFTDEDDKTLPSDIKNETAVIYFTEPTV